MRQSNNKSFLRKFFSLIICFVLCLTVFLLSLLIVFKMTVGNENQINNTLISSKYCAFLTQEIRDKMYDYGDVCGIPHSIFDKVITENIVLNDSRDYFNNCFSNKPSAINYNSLSNDLTNKINDYSKTINTSKTTPNQLKENIAVFVQQCITTYNDSISIPFLPVIGGMVVNSSAWITLAVIILLLLFIIGLIFLYSIQIWSHHFWRYLVYIFTGSALMLLVMPVYVFINKIISRISLNQKSLYCFINSFFTNILYFFLIIVFILIILAVLSQVNSIYIKNKYDRR